MGEQWGDRPISLDELGRAQEYSLRYAVTFELRRADGTALVPRQTIELARDYVSNPVQAIGTEGEREILQVEMRREMVASVLRRLDAVARRATAQAAAPAAAPGRRRLSRLRRTRRRPDGTAPGAARRAARPGPARACAVASGLSDRWPRTAPRARSRRRRARRRAPRRHRRARSVRGRRQPARARLERAVRHVPCAEPVLQPSPGRTAPAQRQARQGRRGGDRRLLCRTRRTT